MKKQRVVCEKCIMKILSTDKKLSRERKIELVDKILGNVAEPLCTNCQYILEQVVMEEKDENCKFKMG